MSQEKLLNGHGMLIVGAGLAGLLAANFFKRYNPLVIEAQPELPNNHEALLRFRTDKVSQVTSIPFKKVSVQKAIWDNEEKKLTTTPRLDYSNAYSRKVSGGKFIQSRSINNLDPVDRYIAPLNLISLMATEVKIKYEATFDRDWIAAANKFGIPIVSTIPMPILMSILDYRKIDEHDFDAIEISSYSADIVSPSVDVYQTVYFPENNEFSPYRASITGNHLIVEVIGGHDERFPIDYTAFYNLCMEQFKMGYGFGFHNQKSKSQKYGKLVNPNQDKTKKFIYDTTVFEGIYSLGRFATWRQILLDDVVDDCHSIQRMIESGNYLR